MSCHFISPSKIEMQTQQSFVCFSPGWLAGLKLILCTARKKCAINFTCHSRAYRVCRLIEVDGSMVGQNIIATRTLLLHLNCFSTLCCYYFTLRGGIDSRDESLVFTTRCVSCHHHHLMVMQLQKGFTFSYTDIMGMRICFSLDFCLLFFTFRETNYTFSEITKTKRTQIELF